MAPYFCAPYLYFCTSLLPLDLQRLAAHLRRLLISRLCFSPRLRFALSTHPSPSLAPSLRVPLFCPCSCSLLISDPSCHPLPDPDRRLHLGYPSLLSLVIRTSSPHCHDNLHLHLHLGLQPQLRQRIHYAAITTRNSNDDDDDLSTISRPTSQLIASVALSLALLFWHPARPTRPLMIPFWSLLVLFIYPV